VSQNALDCCRCQSADDSFCRCEFTIIYQSTAKQPSIIKKYKTKNFKKGKGGPYSTVEHRVPELILLLSSQPAGDVSHKPGSNITDFKNNCLMDEIN